MWIKWNETAAFKLHYADGGVGEGQVREPAASSPLSTAWTRKDQLLTGHISASGLQIPSSATFPPPQ